MHREPHPKAYTGAKLVGRGALPLAGEQGIGALYHAITQGLGAPDPAAHGSREEVDVYAAFSRPRSASSNPARSGR